jgi:Pyridoxamine 5'-phosphate oxidase
MIDKELAAFLQEGIAIQIGTRNAALEPNGARVVAVKVESDGQHVIAYVPKLAAPQVVPDLDANGQVALVFARPPDERACQVKGVVVETRAARPSERSFVVDQWDRWLTRLEGIGYPRAAVENWQTWPCVAIRLRVTALFNQTPGPGAGAALT